MTSLMVETNVIDDLFWVESKTDHDLFLVWARTDDNLLQCSSEYDDWAVWRAKKQNTNNAVLVETETTNTLFGNADQDGGVCDLFSD